MLCSSHLKVCLLEDVSPSIVKFVKDDADGREYEGALHNASRVLKSGLALLSDNKTESGLSKTFLNVINRIVKLRKNGYSEAQSIVEIAQKIIM